MVKAPGSLQTQTKLRPKSIYETFEIASTKQPHPATLEIPPKPKFESLSYSQKILGPFRPGGALTLTADGYVPLEFEKWTMSDNFW